MHYKPLTEQEIDIMILDFMEHQSQSFELYVDMEIGFHQDEYMVAFQIFKQVMARSKTEGNDYTTNPKKMAKSLAMYQFYMKIKTYIETREPKLKISRYQVKLYLFSHFFETRMQTWEKTKNEWKKPRDYCLEWKNNIIATNQSTLKINDCYSSALHDSHHKRYVCEYADYTYSLNTDFPCNRFSESKKRSEYGRFCKLS